MIPDVAQATRFLAWLSDRPTVLLTIPMEGGLPSTSVPSDLSAFLSSSAEQQLNVYLQPARVSQHAQKASKDEVTSVGVLWIDLDPKEATPAARAALLGLLTSDRPSAIPEPSAVVFSGGGFQAYWKLEVPFEVSSLAAVLEFEEHTRWLTRTFRNQDQGGWNIDRILRLPGSVNWPKAAKREKGQEPALAQIVELSERVYKLEDFGRDQQGSGLRQELGDESSRRPSTTDPGLIKFSDLSALDDYEIPVRVLDTIVEGKGKEPKHGDNSRSAWVFDVVCNLLRFGVPEGMILWVLLNPDWAISESVLDKRGGARKYALKQITSGLAFIARDPDAAPDSDNTSVAQSNSPEPRQDLEDDPVYENCVEWINRRYFAILMGGRHAFCRENVDGSFTRMNSDAFDFELQSHRIFMQGTKGNTTAVPISKIWKEDRRRRYFPRGFVLDDKKIVEGAYNLWRGFSVEPKQGNWTTMREHILMVLASGNKALAEYIIRWTAWTVQNPSLPARVALVFQGTEGVGKGIFANAIVALFGEKRHGLRIQSMAHIVGRFNEHLRHCCVLFCDEATATGNESDGAMKGLITESSLPIEGKGRDLESSDNHLHILMASNEDWVVPAGKDSRRYVVLKVSSHRQGQRDYFDAILGQMYDDGGLAAMLYDLQNMKLGNWHPEENRPDTDALHEQRAFSLRGFDKIYQDILITGTIPGIQERAVTVPYLISVVGRTVRKENLPSGQEVIFILKRTGWKKMHSRDQNGDQYWSPPPLEEARMRFNPKFPWPKEPEDWELLEPPVDIM